MHTLESAALRRIVSLCVDGPASVKELSDRGGLPLASTYRQVKSLLDGGVLVVERSAMTQEGKPIDLYRSRVRTAQLTVRAQQILLTWEPNESVEDRLASLWGHLAG